MNEETNHNRFWRNLVICCVLCLVLFWLPAAHLVIREWVMVQ